MDNLGQSRKKMNLFEYHKVFDQDVMLSYKGPFDSHILSILGNYIEVFLTNDKNAGRKMFKIFIELAQNIATYSEELNHFRTGKPTGIGTIAVGESVDHFILATGNLVKTKNVIPVIERCELINSLDRDSLRKYKIEQRNLAANEIDRANIGLIMVALTSAQPLDIEVVPVDKETSFFTISVKINKI